MCIFSVTRANSLSLVNAHLVFDVERNIETKRFATYLCILIGNGWDGRIRTYGTLYQKQLPYHLATSQQWRDVYDGRAL